MRGKFLVAVGGKGEYKFDDGRSLQWVELIDPVNGEVVRANVAQDYTPNGELTTLAQGAADCELYRANDGKLKLRLHHFAPAKAA